MATNLALGDNLIESARRAGGHKAKKQAVTAALAEYAERRKQLRLSLIHIFSFRSGLQTWKVSNSRLKPAARFRVAFISVSYTHLDVYKRQVVVLIHSCGDRVNVFRRGASRQRDRNQQ